METFPQQSLYCFIKFSSNYRSATQRVYIPLNLSNETHITIFSLPKINKELTYLKVHLKYFVNKEPLGAWSLLHSQFLSKSLRTVFLCLRWELNACVDFRGTRIWSQLLAVVEAKTDQKHKQKICGKFVFFNNKFVF